MQRMLPYKLEDLRELISIYANQNEELRTSYNQLVALLIMMMDKHHPDGVEYTQKDMEEILENPRRIIMTPVADKDAVYITIEDKAEEPEEEETPKSDLVIVRG